MEEGHYDSLGRGEEDGSGQIFQDILYLEMPSPTGICEVCNDLSAVLKNSDLSGILLMAWASNPLATIGFPQLELISVTDPTNLPCPIRHFSSSRSRNNSNPSQKV